MKSPVIKRSIIIVDRKTSVSLEDAFWKGLKEIAARRGTTLSALVAAIDAQRDHGNLSSAIRLFILDNYRSLPAGSLRGQDGGRPCGDPALRPQAAPPAAVRTIMRSNTY